MISALLFDFDGVLSNSFLFHFRAWQKVLPRIGVEPEALVIKQHEGEPAWKIVQAMCQHAGKPVSEPQARSLSAEKNRLFRMHSPPPVFPEIEHILDWAKPRMVKTAVVTGTDRDNLLHVLGPLLHRFDVTLGEGDYQKGKPDPEPYLTAAARLTLPPQRCVVIENAPMGIHAAKAAGMFCVAIKTTLTDRYLSEADLILPDHAALLNWLKKMIEH